MLRRIKRKDIIFGEISKFTTETLQRVSNSHCFTEKNDTFGSRQNLAYLMI